MEHTKLKNAVFAVLSALIIAMIAFTLLDIAKYPLIKVMNLVCLVSVLIYTAVSYRKPHGNLLKYAMLIFALTLIVNGASCLDQGFAPLVPITLLSAAACGVCYVSGRLDRVTENAYLLAAIELVLVACYLSVLFAAEFIISFRFCFLAAVYPVVFGIIIASYFLRFAEHKQAGKK